MPRHLCISLSCSDRSKSRISGRGGGVGDKGAKMLVGGHRPQNDLTNCQAFLLQDARITPPGVRPSQCKDCFSFARAFVEVKPIFSGDCVHLLSGKFNSPHNEKR